MTTSTIIAGNDDKNQNDLDDRFPAKPKKYLSQVKVNLSQVNLKTLLL
jgi:hypothetical protein